MAATHHPARRSTALCWLPGTALLLIAVCGAFLLIGAGTVMASAAAHPAPTSRDGTVVETPRQSATFESSQRLLPDSLLATSLASDPKAVPVDGSELQLNERDPAFPTQPLYLLCCSLLN